MTVEPRCVLIPSEAIKFRTRPTVLPSPVSFCLEFSICHVTTRYNGFLLCGHSATTEGSSAFSLNDQLVIWARGRKWNLLACPRSVSSASLATERFSLKDILLWNSHLYHQLCQRKFNFPHCFSASGSLVLISLCRLAQEMKRQPTNTKVTSTKEQTPNLQRITGTAGMGQGTARSVTVNWKGFLFWKGVDPTVTAEDLGLSILAFSPICARVTLPQQRPMWRTATCQQRSAAEKEASVEQTRLEFGVILGLEISYPNQNITPGQACRHWVFPQLATVPTIEMLSRVTTNRLEGEASVGHEPSLFFYLPRRTRVPTACQTSRHPI